MLIVGDANFIDSKSRKTSYSCVAVWQMRPIDDAKDGRAIGSNSWERLGTIHVDPFKEGASPPPRYIHTSILGAHGPCNSASCFACLCHCGIIEHRNRIAVDPKAMFDRSYCDSGILRTTHYFLPPLSAVIGFLRYDWG